MSHQSDWSYYKQLIKLPLVKVNHVCEDLILILNSTVGFSVKQKQVLLWPYSDISDASFAMVDPSTLWMGFKRVLKFVHQLKNHSLWHTLTCHQGTFA